MQVMTANDNNAATPTRTAALLRLALLRQQAEERCAALAPPALGDWSREDEEAFERASAFSDSIEAAIEALTGSRNSLKRREMLTVPQAATQISRLVGMRVNQNRLTYALRVGRLGGIKVGGRWYVTKSSLRGYCDRG
jgi:hypothetical protein